VIEICTLFAPKKCKLRLMLLTKFVPNSDKKGVIYAPLQKISTHKVLTLKCTHVELGYGYWFLFMIRNVCWVFCACIKSSNGGKRL
jgi:hypothetical protein